jgi:HAE1 family hydrophobic/amphiphilic exporter-1
VYLAASQTPATIDELRALTVPSAIGPIPLSEVAVVEESEGPTSISTQRGQRTATVTVTPATDDLNAASATVNEALADTELPASADAELGGVLSQQQDAFSQLGLALLAAILIVYIVMVATFKSLRQPLLLLVSVPFAATGAILLQIITGVPLGVASLIGVLMLIGIVVTNAIVLVDLVNQYREKGLSAHDATIAGGSRRLRPILMTALATIFALTPMAMGITGHGGFISQPLAIVVIGGLISSTVLTLLVLPTLYNLVEGAKERRAARQAARDGSSKGEADAATGGGPGDDERELVGASLGAAVVGGAVEGGTEPVYETRRARRARQAALAAGTTAAVEPAVTEADPAGPAETAEPDAAAGTAEPDAAAAETESAAAEAATGEAPVFIAEVPAEWTEPAEEAPRPEFVAPFVGDPVELDEAAGEPAAPDGADPEPAEAGEAPRAEDGASEPSETERQRVVEPVVEPEPDADAEAEESRGAESDATVDDAVASDGPDADADPEHTDR